MSDNGPIWRGDSWWQQQGDGAWLRWQPTTSSWERQVAGPPPPTPPAHLISDAPATSSGAAVPAASVPGRTSVDVLPAVPPGRGFSFTPQSLGLRLAAGALVLVVLLAGGFLLTRPSDAGSSESLQAITLAAAHTREAGTAKMAMTMSFNGIPAPTGGDSISMSASGAMDFARNRGTLTMDMSSFAPPGMPGMGRVQMVFDEFVVYMQMPGIAQFAGGKSWLKFDASAMAQQQGVDLQSLSQFGNSDPTQGLQYLEGVAGEVEVVGQEVVRGQPTTHYRATVDLIKAAEQAPPKLRQLAVQSTKVITDQLGTDSIPMDVWIDDAGLLRQMYYSLDMGGVEGMPEDASMTITMQMYDFGSKVRIRVPPAYQVADIAQLAGASP
ncbi:MAG: hypothetical protein ABR505_07410 [Actinomycetota bacterium]